MEERRPNQGISLREWGIGIREGVMYVCIVYLVEALGLNRENDLMREGRLDTGAKIAIQPRTLTECHKQNKNE